jgi:hypothetical protein
MINLIKSSLIMFMMLLMYSVVFEDPKQNQPNIASTTRTPEQKAQIREFHREVLLAQIRLEERELARNKMAGY